MRVAGLAMALAVLAFVSAATAAETPAASAAAALKVAAPGGIEFTVTADGLAGIRVGDREVAKGGWRAVNADGRFKAGTGKVRIEKIVEKSIQIDSPRQARVRHVYEDAVATFDYTFEGEDVTIRARVENHSPDAAIAVTGFTGLAFTFNGPPKGQMPGWHVSYLQHQGTKICHPSYWVRAGGSYATDDRFGVGLTPQKTGLARTLFHWDRNWGIQKGEEDPGPRTLAYLVPAEVPPGGARTFQMLLRVSTNTDWHHLLEPYKAHFLATFGPLAYKPDHRAMVYFASSADVWVKPDNPFGFNGPNRRFDLPEGAKAFCDWVVPAMKEADANGVIFWALQGHEPRGAIYRPDFEIFPPPIEANLPVLNREFTAAGLRWGVCTRPGEIAYRLNWAKDATLRINPDDPEHIEMMWARFKTMIEKGGRVFYLDTFGNSLEDVKAMRIFRERMGPDIQAFVEHQSDAIVPYAGAYTEVNYDEKTRTYRSLVGEWNWEFFRWLVGNPQVVANPRCQARPAGSEESVYRWTFRHRMTPLVEDWLIGKAAAELKTLRAEFLDTPDRWK